MKTIVLSLSFLMTSALFFSCGNGEGGDEEVNVCNCQKWMDERESELSEAENREEVVKKWKSKTADCNKLFIKMDQDELDKKKEACD